MRRMCVGTLVVCLTVGLTAQSRSDRAEQVLAEARAVLGGASRLAAIRTLTASGKSMRSVGPLQLAGVTDVHLSFPDRYVRVDRITIAGLEAEMAVGFDGAMLIQRAISGKGLRAAPVTPVSVPSQVAALAGARQDLALLLLGFFAGSFDFHPLRFEHAGTAEAPEGTADVIDVSGAGILSARLFIDSRSRRPLMVAWSGPDVMAAARQLATSVNGPTAIDLEALTKGPRVEHRLYFADYRAVGGFTWPFTVRRAIAGKPSEELAFTRIIPNAQIDPRVFDPDR